MYIHLYNIKIKVDGIQDHMDTNKEIYQQTGRSDQENFSEKEIKKNKRLKYKLRDKDARKRSSDIWKIRFIYFKNRRNKDKNNNYFR